MKKILVVDDDPMVLELLKKYLSKPGIEIKTAIDGAEALRLITEDHFDVLLTDYIMKEMDGLELIKQVQDDHPDLSIMAMSSEYFREMFKKAGIDYFFSKPLNLCNLADTVHRILK